MLLGLLAASLAACLYLFVTLKAEWRAEQTKRKRRETDLEDSVATWRAAYEEMRTDLENLAQRVGESQAPRPAEPGMNLTKRSQVLRLHRQGESSAHIAAVLHLPLAEVELVLKVHRAVVLHF
jgi:DNA-binding NarL/FixJ family response regulator